MAAYLLSTKRRLKSLWTKHEEPTNRSRVSADLGGVAKTDMDHEISLPQFVRSPPNPSAAPSCAGCHHKSQKLPRAVLLNMTDPSVIAVLQPALVSMWGRMVPVWVRFMFVRAVVSKPARAAFPFSKSQDLSPQHILSLSLSFKIAILRKLPWSGFSTCPQYGFSLSLPKVVISSCNSCGVAFPAAQLHVQAAVKWSLQDS